MDLEVALDLLQCFLEKGGVDCIKHLVGLVTLGQAKGCFQNPDSLFDASEWRKLGDVLWGIVIDEDKAAKKLMKPWREVVNHIKRYQLEKNLATVATERRRGKEAYRQEHHQPMTCCLGMIVFHSPLEVCQLQ